LGYVASDILVAESSFLSFDFLDGSRVDGLSRFSCGVDHNHSFKLSRQVFLAMFFQWFVRNLSSFLHDSTLSLTTHETKPLPPPSQKIANPKHLCRYRIKCLLNAMLVITICISPVI